MGTKFEILLVLISLMSDSSMMDKLNPVEDYVSILWLSRTHIADKLRSQGAVLLKNHHGPLGRRARWCNPGERCSH